MGRLLCSLGIHRWEFYDGRLPGHRIATYARCARRCDRFPDWHLVNIDRL